LTNTDRLLNSAVHKRQNYDQIRTVVSIDRGIFSSLNVRTRVTECIE